MWRWQWDNITDIEVEFRSKVIEGLAFSRELTWLQNLFCNSLASDCNSNQFIYLLLWANLMHYCGWIVVICVYSFWGFLDAKNHFWRVAKEDFIIVEIENLECYSIMCADRRAVYHLVREYSRTFDHVEWPFHVIKNMMLRSLCEWMPVLNCITWICDVIYFLV